MRVIHLSLLSGLLLAANPAALQAQDQPATPVQKTTIPAEPLPEPDRLREANSLGEVYTYVEQMPEFPGGQPALFQTLGRTVFYPTEALRQRQEGRVFVTFVVGATGAVREAQVSKSLYPLLDAAAIKAVMGLPDFKPGKQNGKPKAVRQTIPITFHLPENVDQLLARRVESQETASVLAEFSGGPEALRTYLNAVPLPADFRPGEGPLPEVFVSFVVDAAGRISQVVGLPPIPGEKQGRQHKPLRAAAISYVSAMPAWAPARLKGLAVPTSYIVPVSFSGTQPRTVYAYAEQLPVFSSPGGEQAHIGRNIRYPANALRNGTQGVVLAYYEVAESGLVENVKIIQSVSPDIDAEVKRVLQSNYPVYQPAQQQGKPVRVFLIVPTTFAIK